MQFSILGTLAVRDDSGEEIAVRGVLQRRLLGLLVCNAGRVTSTELLIGALWNGSPPPSAGKTLQSHIVRLRSAIDPARRLLETRPSGYVLQVGREAVDALRFERLVMLAGHASAAGVPDSAAAMLADALALWRGTAAYADLRDCDVLDREGARLDAVRQSALEDRVEADLACGRGPELVPELEMSAQHHPFRERLWRLLAVALYRSGRQVDALAALQLLRAELREELGVDPSVEIRDVEEAILRHDPALAPVPALDRVESPLPPELTVDTWPLVSRDGELEWLLDAWGDAARCRGGLVLIKGSAGMGRTRLLAELARDVAAQGVRVRFASGRAQGDLLTHALNAGSAGRLVASDTAAVVVALEQTATQAPCLVVLDDLHLSRGGLATLEPAAARARDLPALIAASYDANAVSPELASLVEKLDPVGDHTLELLPLPADAVAQVVARTVSEPDRRAATVAAAGAHDHPRQLRLAVTRAVEEAADQRIVRAANDAHDRRQNLLPARQALTSGVLDLSAAREERAAAEATEAPGWVVCPFKGLAAYDVADAAFFVGRERLTAQLVARLVEDRLVAVVGASGSGKSSVARAGLLAALADDVLPGSAGWRQIIIFPGADPPASLQRGLGDPGVGPLLILVDQFEEVFTSCGDNQLRADFLAALLDLIDRGARIVLTLRADYLGHCAAFPDFAGRVVDSSVLVGPLTETEVRRLVEVPARRAGLSVAPELVTLVTGEVAGQPDSLPLLSTALLRTWENRSGITLSTRSYRQGGGIARAVERLGESAYAQLDPVAAAAARRLLIRLADPGPGEHTLVRRRAPSSELVGEGDTAAQRALDVLAARRLVTVTDELTEVTHEALFTAWPRLRAWLEEDEAGRRVVRHLSAAAADWLARGREDAELYRGTRLQAALDWAEQHADDLTDNERDFLTASADAADRHRRETAARLTHERRARRQLTRTLIALAVVMIVALTAAGIAVTARGNAEEAARTAGNAARIAEAQRLGSLGLVNQDLDHALLLAVQAVRLDDSPETRGDLLATLLRSPAVLAVIRPPGGHRMLSLDMAPDGRTVLIGDNAGNLLLIDTTSHAIDALYRPGGNETMPVAEFSADGRSVAAMHTRGNLSWVDVWNLRTRAVQRVPHSEDVLGIGWSPTGRRMAIVKSQQDAIVVDLDRPNKHPVALTGSAGEDIAPVIWSGPDAVIISPIGKPLGVWDSTTGRRTASVDVGGQEVTIGVSPDRRTIALGNSSEVGLYDPHTMRRRAVLTGYRAPILDLAFSPDGHRLASVSDDREVVIWNVATKTLEARLTGHAGRISREAWAPDSRTLWTASGDGTVMAWDIAGQRRLARPIAPSTSPAEWFGIDADGDRAVAGFSNGQARSWDLATGRPLAGPFKVSDQTLPSVGISPDGSLFVVCSWDGHANAYRTDTGQRIATLAGLSGQPVLDASFSPDGRTVAISTLERKVTLIDTATWRPTGPPIEPGVPVFTTIWSPDSSSVLFTSDATEEVSVWSALDRRLLAILTPGPGGARSAAFSPGGTRVAIGSADGQIVFYDPAGWRPLGEPVAVGAAVIVSMSYSPDGRSLVVGAHDGTIRLLDAITRKPIGPPIPGANIQNAFVRWIPGERIDVGFGDGSILSYDADQDAWIRRACSTAGRQLTQAEWDAALPGRPYQRTCR